MPKLAANLTMLWSELAFLDRFKAAAGAGFSAVEYLFPYPYPAAQLREQLETYRLTQVLHNLPAGDWAKGDRGIACQPERRGEFRDGVGLAIDYAKALGCDRLNCLAGIAPDGASEDVLRATFVDNLRFASAELGKAKIRLLIEPINTRDIPGFYLRGTQQALAIMDEVGSPHLFLQYDIYHMQIMEGDLGASLKQHLARIAHVQIADNPGRNEPGTGEVHHPFLFELLDREGYTGYVGCEYKPRTTTDAGLSWAKPYLRYDEPGTAVQR
jgi:hydroxypyruvate isomerase